MSQIPVGWLIFIEGFETSPEKEVNDEPDRPLYFYQKDIYGYISGWIVL